MQKIVSTSVNKVVDVAMLPLDLAVTVVSLGIDLSSDVLKSAKTFAEDSVDKVKKIMKD